MNDFRLGDVIDDFCVKCRRLTNHAIVSLVDDQAAKVRCRTCYHDHDYRHEQAPPSKKELKKMELFKEVLATVAPGAAVDGEVTGETPTEAPPTAEDIPEDPIIAAEEPGPAPPEEPIAETVPAAVSPAPKKAARARGKKA